MIPSLITKRILHATNFSLRIVRSSLSDYCQSTRFLEMFVRAGTTVKFSGNIHKFSELVLGFSQKQYEDFVYSRLVTCTKNISDAINKNSFVTPDTKQI